MEKHEFPLIFLKKNIISKISLLEKNIIMASGKAIKLFEFFFFSKEGIS